MDDGEVAGVEIFGGTLVVEFPGATTTPPSGLEPRLQARDKEAPSSSQVRMEEVVPVGMGWVPVVGRFCRLGPPMLDSVPYKAQLKPLRGAPRARKHGSIVPKSSSLLVSSSLRRREFSRPFVSSVLVASYHH